MRRSSDEHGLALLETLLLGLLFLAPLIWVLGVLADVQRGALASNAAARDAGFEAARAVTSSEAALAVDRAVARAFTDHGLDAGKARVQWVPTPALERGAVIEIEVSYPVTVMQAPFLGRVGGPSIWIRARHLARVDPFRSRG